MQKLVPTQSMVDSTVGYSDLRSPPVGSIKVFVQAVGPPVGLVEISAKPRPPTPTHSDTVGHEIAYSPPEYPRAKSAIGVAFQALGPPVGSVDMRKLLLALSNTTHSLGDGHETLDSWPCCWAIPCDTQALGPPAGSVET